MTQPNDKPPQDPPDLSKPAPSEKATTNLKPIPTSTRSLNPPTTTPKFLLITKSGNPKFMKEVEKSTSSQLEVHLENNNSDDDSKTPEQETSGQSKMEDEVPNSQEAKTNHNSKSSVQNFPKVSSNFDKINHNKKANASEAPNRNEQMGANPTRPASNQCQSEISMNPHGVGIRIPTTTMNRQNNPGTSKPSLTAAVQAKLAIGNSGKTPVSIKHGMHLGKTTVFFIVRDYFVNLAQDCKFTIIGKLYRGKPTMEDLRKEFVSQFQLRGTVKISHFDHQHVYLDFDNEVDFTHVGTRSFVNIGIAPMKIMK